MPIGVYKRTKKHRDIARLSLVYRKARGEKVGYQKGHPYYGNSFNFKKGSIAWNKGLKMSPLSEETKVKMSKEKKGKVPANIEMLREFSVGENNWIWKGEEAGYASKHTWNIKNFGHPLSCEDCGRVGKYYFRKNGSKVWDIDWSNIDGEYKRGIENYQGRCRKCHFKYDRELCVK